MCGALLSDLQTVTVYITLQDDDSPEAEPVVITSEETVVSHDEYDYAATSIDWLNHGYLNSTVTGE